MRRLTLAVLALMSTVAAGCSTAPSDAPATSEPAAAAATTAAASGAPTSSVPAIQVCKEMLTSYAQLRDVAESAGAAFDPATAAEDLIMQTQQDPGWAAVPEAQRRATLAGIRDAADGNCG